MCCSLSRSAFVDLADFVVHPPAGACSLWALLHGSDSDSDAVHACYSALITRHDLRRRQ